ncbi:MAG: hypothetical protein ACI9JM_002748 [Halioglobus sp.]|jgi:uncharacterized protein YheU (UPF0270 family)
MAQFITVPPDQLQAEVLNSLLEEYASRDGTDYGEQEVALERKVASLLGQLERGDLKLLYDSDSQEWDLLPSEQADLLLDS